MKKFLLNYSRKKGFTLAEVLITLGIIGVVAAITMPTLIQNYKKHVAVTQLKKTISTFQQGINMILAQEEVDNLENTELFKEMRNNSNQGECDGYSIESDSGCLTFGTNFSKYFKGSMFEKIGHGYAQTGDGITDDMSNAYFLVLPDGALINLNTLKLDDDTSMIPQIDINGLKGPNNFGDDIFYFKVLPNGKCDLTYDKNLKKIVENGWKMD